MAQNTKSKGIWQEALAASRRVLGDDDFEIVQRYGSADQMLDEVQRLERKYTNSAVPRLLKGLKPQLHHFQAFVTLVMISVGLETIGVAAIWGTLYLLIELASHSESALSRISFYLKDLGEKLTLFEEYNKSLDSDPELMASFFELLVELVLDSAAAIKHFRKNDIQVAITMATWNKIDQKFCQTLQELANKIDHLKKIIEARQLTKLTLSQTELIQALNRYNTNGPPLGSSDMSLPYYQLPFGRNPAFFGRSSVLRDIQSTLEAVDTARSIRSVAIWGTGGIGKSQVALEYANLQLTQGKCKLILWLPSETDTELSEALVDAATKVRPPGFVEGSSPEQIKFAMWNWLQTTDVPWLIIFDNVENNERLLQSWPTTGSGQIVVTCRSELVAASPAAHSLEIFPFDNVEGGELLLTLSGRSVVDIEEQDAARRLSDLLGGLPLAIDITARQILVKKKPMRQFLPYFVKNREMLRLPPKYASKNPYYSMNLVNVWQTAFAGLGADSSTLLGAIAMIAPDGIPRDLLHRGGIGDDDERWRCLRQTTSYEEAEEQLLYLSLIKINQDTEVISIHRLTQEAFYFEMNEEQRRDAFELAYRLVCDAFPKRRMGRHMYEDWGVCEQLIHHVVALQDKYEDLRQRGYDNQDEGLASLMADAAWFCGESHTLLIGDKIGRRAADNCADRKSLVYSYLCESVATIDHRRGHYHNAYDYHNRALQVRKNCTQTPPYLLAEGYSAVGRTLYGLWRNAESLEMLNRAVEIMDSVPPEERLTFNPDRYLRNLSRSTAALGRFEEAKAYAAAADKCQTEMYGPGSHFHGETAYILGRMAAEEGDTELAIHEFQRAIDLQAQGKPTHQSVAAALYRQGLICMQRQRNRKSDGDEALLRFQHSLKICQFNELKRGDEGESPRVKWRISQILERQGRVSDAETYLEAALRSKLALEKTGLFPTAPDELQSWDCFTDCVDR